MFIAMTRLAGFWTAFLLLPNLAAAAKCRLDVCLAAVTTDASVPQSVAAQHLQDCSSFFSITTFLPPKTTTITISALPTTVTDTTTDATRTISELDVSTTTATQTLTSLYVSTSTTVSTSFVGVLSFPPVSSESANLQPREVSALSVSASDQSSGQIRSPTRVPNYATAACTDAAQYSSACAQLGLAPHTLTLNGQSVTVTVTVQSTVVRQQEATSTLLTTTTSVTTTTTDTTTTVVSTTVVRNIATETSPVPWCTPSEENTAVDGCNGRQFANTCFQRLVADASHPVLFSAQQLNAHTCATVCDTDSLCTAAFFSFDTRVCVGLAGANPETVNTSEFVESFLFDGTGTNSACPSYACPDSNQDEFCCGGTGCGSEL